MKIAINSAFDSGNIEVISAQQPNDIRLAIRKDDAADFLQWFHFRLSGAKDTHCTLQIINAGNTSYPRGWENYAVATSHDRQHWYRTPATFDGQTLSWSVTPSHEALWFAYFAPYSLERHSDLIARCACESGVSLDVLGQTLAGRDLDCLHLSSRLGLASANTSKRRHVWSIGRQHPGESMAAWWMEGWLERLLDGNDATSRALRELADIHVVPNMNPDGTFCGNLRTNTAGTNLNREWAQPSMARSPEVFLVQQRMRDTGVDINLDVHGDEVLPYNFIAGSEGVPGWTAERDKQLIAFKHTLSVLNPDFQTAQGYPRPPTGTGNLTYCSNSVANEFGCLAVTLEMPFKDTANAPQPGVGWSPERCRRLGGSFVDAVYMALTNQLLSPG